MTEHEKDLVLSVVKYHMDMKLRAQLMREVPQAYNALVGGNYVTCVHTGDSDLSNCRLVSAA